MKVYITLEQGESLNINPDPRKPKRDWKEAVRTGWPYLLAMAIYLILFLYNTLVKQA